MKNPNRRFSHCEVLEVGTLESLVILCEEYAHLPRGHARRKWEGERIRVTREELAELARKYPVITKERS